MSSRPVSTSISASRMRPSRATRTSAGSAPRWWCARRARTRRARLRRASPTRTAWPRRWRANGSRCACASAWSGSTTTTPPRLRFDRRAQDQLRGTRPSAACALALASCFLTSIARVFDFAAGDGFCLLPAAVSPALAACALPLASGFLTSIPGVFDFAAGDGFCLPPATVSPAPATLPLAFCVRFLDLDRGSLRFGRRRRLLLAAGDGLAGAGSLRFGFGVRFLDFRSGDLRCRRRRWLLLAAGHGLAGGFVFAFDVLFLDLDLGGFRLRRRRLAQTGRHGAGGGANSLPLCFALPLARVARRALPSPQRGRHGLAGPTRPAVGGVGLAFAALGPGFERRRLRVRRG